MRASVLLPTMLGLALAWTGGAQAQADLFSPDTLHGLADLRLSAADGETSWLKGGFGKTAESGAGSGLTGRLHLSEAALEWRPRLSFAVSAVVTAEWQPDVQPRLDLGEAYLKLQAPPQSWGRLSARAGLFYPPVSMEHPGLAWTDPDMLSASAINTWIGEEVKVGGIEATFQRPIGEHQFAVTAAVFGWDDTSGTLLSFRGWSLGSVKGGVSTAFELPPLSPFMRTKQDDETYTLLELDRRAGYYGRLEWRPPAPVSFNATYYDNGGNRISVNPEKQWSWETRFLNLGAKWELDDETRLLAQAMDGETLMGVRTPSGIWIDVGYSAAYLLAQRDLGADRLSGRLDVFSVRDRSYKTVDDNSEHGWAMTADWRHPLSAHADLLLEMLHVQSDRPARALAGEAAPQSQTVLQSALRLSF